MGAEGHRAASQGNIDKSFDIDWMQEFLDTHVQTDPQSFERWCKQKKKLQGIKCCDKDTFCTKRKRTSLWQPHCVLVQYAAIGSNGWLIARGHIKVVGLHMCVCVVRGLGGGGGITSELPVRPYWHSKGNCTLVSNTAQDSQSLRHDLMLPSIMVL